MILYTNEMRQYGNVTLLYQCHSAFLIYSMLYALPVLPVPGIVPGSLPALSLSNGSNGSKGSRDSNVSNDFNALMEASGYAVTST